MTDRLVTIADIYLSPGQSLARQRAEGFRPRSDVKPWPFALPIDWGHDFGGDMNWQFQLHGWRMTDPYLSDWQGAGAASAAAAPLIDEVFDIAEDWWAYVTAPGRAPPAYAWHDMATGIRAMRIAFLLDLVLSGTHQVTAERRVRLEAMADEHARRLRDPAFIAVNNHGIVQLAGLNLLGVVAGDRPACAGARAFAADMFARVFATQFTDEAVLKEHSPHYHAFFVSLMARLGGDKHIGSPAMTETLRRAAELTPWMAFPDGQLARVGDTDGRHPAPKSAPPEMMRDLTGMRVAVLDLSRSGYVAVRSDPALPVSEQSMLFVTGMSHGKLHKHADDLSFELFEAGQFIFVDTGKYAYVRDEKRAYALSARGHNTISIEGRDTVPRHVPLHGSCLVAPLVREDHVEVSGTLEFPKLFKQHRTIAYRPGAYLNVADQLQSNGLKTFVSSLHLNPAATVARTAQGATVTVGGLVAEISVEERDVRLDIEDAFCTLTYGQPVANKVLRASGAGRRRSISWRVVFGRE